jgi:hypothetical protein
VCRDWGTKAQCQLPSINLEGTGTDPSLRSSLALAFASKNHLPRVCLLGRSYRHFAPPNFHAGTATWRAKNQGPELGMI